MVIEFSNSAITNALRRQSGIMQRAKKALVQDESDRPIRACAVIRLAILAVKTIMAGDMVKMTGDHGCNHYSNRIWAL